MCAQRGGSHGQLVCRRNAEFLCQHPPERDHDVVLSTYARTTRPGSRATVVTD